MKNVKNIVTIGLVIVAAAAVLIAKNIGKKSDVAVATAAVSAEVSPESAAQGKAIPRLVDLGAGKCIPCKMMAPILEDLKKTYVGRMNVQFIDVWENPGAGKTYGINVIPTQIFYDAAGKELSRHEGFISKEDILNTWKKLGVEFSSVPEELVPIVGKASE